ncbi:MAG: hypothetical protein WDM80_00390 [Limisphaerales bacterium]
MKTNKAIIYLLNQTPKLGSTPAPGVVFRALAENPAAPKDCKRLCRPRAQTAGREARPATPGAGVLPFLFRSSRLFTSAAALVLLCAVTNATALTNSAPANVIAAANNTLPGQTALTPAAPVTSPVSHTMEDIRDIRQPRHLPTPWLWVVAAAGVTIFLAAVVAWWTWLWRKQAVQLSPCETALQHLEAARALMNPQQAREYCFAASKIIRSYVEEQLRVSAPRLTTEEFLRERVEGNDQIVGAHRELLGNFLEHCDLAKFAGWRYSQESLAEMHASAIQFVRQSSAPQVPTSVPESAPVHQTSAVTNATASAI